tara:strand:+ start:85 stop:1002 length:918 start_codon:yes stop_codon:yes gene_type:complete
MTDGQTYYNGLINQGYPAEQALGYTQQYYPGFIPTTAPIAAPMPAPMPQHIQPVVQPMVTAAPMGMAPMGMPPIGGTPVVMGEAKPIMTWAAIACIAMALILSITVQFTNTWQTGSDSEVGFGLNSLYIDCSDSDDPNCNEIAYIMVSEDFNSADPNDAPDDDVFRGSLENYCENSFKYIKESAADNGADIDASVGEVRQECLDMNSAGNVGGIVIWLGAIGALLGTVMMVMGMLGKTLPANAEGFGKITAWVSGVILILGVIIWKLMLPDSNLDLEIGMSFYLAIFAGLLAIIAGILDMLDERE